MHETSEFGQKLNEGDIHFRDDLQFELKSEFFINPLARTNIYKQDFYIFIPSTLQINSQTYYRDQFYLDETNLIRYKTPQISLSSLSKEDNKESPLIRLKLGKKTAPTYEVIDELRLFGNVFKTALRDQMQYIFTELKNHPEEVRRNLIEEIDILCNQIRKIRSTFFEIESDYSLIYPSLKQLHDCFNETDEFISLTIDFYLTPLLKTLRELKLEDSEKCDQDLCKLILQEQQHREDEKLKPLTTDDETRAKESILYRFGLLNRFMLEALLLKSNRISLQERHGNVLGAVAAGIAMLVYMWLLWKSTAFVINSLPFVFLAVVLYVLKDRIKEGIKTLFYRQAFKWYPDYATEIQNKRGRTIGKLSENFSFVDEAQIPEEIKQIRKGEFNWELPSLSRLETVIHYKREVELYRLPPSSESRRRGLTIIFRFNISRFLEKASNPMQANLILDPKTCEVIERLLPKVYHINIIIRSSYASASDKMRIEYKKFRVVVDKLGIKRVEQVK